MRLALALAAGVPLTACGGGASASLLDDSQQRVTAMGEAERAGVLAQAIRGSNRRCARVLSSRPIEPSGPIPTYVATCDNNDRFVVFIRRGGRADAQLTSAGAAS